jgi:hypothetical protein
MPNEYIPYGDRRTSPYGMGEHLLHDADRL